MISDESVGLDVSLLANLTTDTTWGGTSKPYAETYVHDTGNRKIFPET